MNNAKENTKSASFTSIQNARYFSKPHEEVELKKEMEDCMKVKHFLSTLVKFASSLNPEVNEHVKILLYKLMDNSITVEQFHDRVQHVMNFSLKPFVLPFLKNYVPSLQRQLVNETFNEVEDDEYECNRSTTANKCDKKRGLAHKRCNEDKNDDVYLDSTKRWSPNYINSNNATFQKTHNIKDNLKGECRHTTCHNSENEWNNIQVMLSCILSMVEKTKKALAMFEESGEKQCSSCRAKNKFMKVDKTQLPRKPSQFGSTEKEPTTLNRMFMDEYWEKNSSNQLSLGELASCWNCGRKANDKCGGCGLARYCGWFCQKKDWQSHQQICLIRSPEKHPLFTDKKNLMREESLSKLLELSPPTNINMIHDLHKVLSDGPLTVESNKIKTET